MQVWDTSENRIKHKFAYSRQKRRLDQIRFNYDGRVNQLQVWATSENRIKNIVLTQLQIKPPANVRKTQRAGCQYVSCRTSVSSGGGCTKLFDAP